MFEPVTQPRLFGVAPGVDFPNALVRGLEQRLQGLAPEAWARVTLIVNTRRMARRITQILSQGPARLLPRILLVTELDRLLPGPPPAPAVSSLRRRLELATLIARLLDREPDLAARTALFDLSDSLAELLDEMQGEGVSPDIIHDLDVSEFSAHFERTQRFISIAQDYLAQRELGPDPDARQRLVVETLADQWRITPPEHPIIIAGSTGSRGTTLLAMEAVAALPQGAIVVPGFDFDLPPRVWAELADPLTSEDHPQYRFRKISDTLGLAPSEVRTWDGSHPPSPARNRLMSLALRPAPVTDAWLDEGPALGDLDSATQELTLLEADNPRAEALAIAMRLRAAVEEGRTAALITPDRMLTRQVSAALDRWHILPDDSAGMPLHLSPPGRFLRQSAALFSRKLDAEMLLSLLKHPLTHSGPGRNLHQLNTQRLELRIRRNGLPYPEAASLRALAARVDAPDRDAFLAWASWVADTFCGRPQGGRRTLSDWVEEHLQLSNAIAQGPDESGTNELWAKNAGQIAREVMDTLAHEAPHGGAVTAADYADLVGALLQQQEVRDRDAPHPDVMIWGTLEARVQGADLVILGGLNEGIWPEAPKPDPWLNRSLRVSAGLLLPERRIGLAAHDFEQAVAAPEVWVTRAIRSDDAETVPSRWLNRLQNLMAGLPDQNGPAALEAMRARGRAWLGKAREIERAPDIAAAKRPAPRPPAEARPTRLSATEIQTLIRDPYAIYAKHILRLRPLGPLFQDADALSRGRALHKVMELFIQATMDDPGALSEPRLDDIARQVLADLVPWPAARTLWLTRFSGQTAQLIAEERARRAFAVPVALEQDAVGEMTVPETGVLLHARADRIDRRPDGQMILYDYKSGQPPTTRSQIHFDKQLLVEALMVESGAFAAVGAAPVADAIFLGLGRGLKQQGAPLDEEPPAQVLEKLQKLLQSYADPNKGFSSRRAPFTDKDRGDFDQLARFGEWDPTDEPRPETVG